jgi:hypothetical protein
VSYIRVFCDLPSYRQQERLWTKKKTLLIIQ